MIPVKTVLLATALSLGTTMAIAQESGAGEKPTQPNAIDSGSNFEDGNRGPVYRSVPSWNGAPVYQYSPYEYRGTLDE
jgi:hypothetical protein